MSDEHTTTADRLRQFRDANTSSAADRLEEAKKLDADAHATFTPGAHVLDLVSGQQGVVASGALTSTVYQRPVEVRLDSGIVVVRRPNELLARPTPPRA